MNKLSIVTVLALIGSAGLAIAEPEKKEVKQPETSTPAPKVNPPTKDEKKDDKKEEKKEDKKDDKKKVEAKLVVGSDAPKIEVTKWVKGKEVKSFEKGKVYIVEFWATWCTPCLKSIPHLTELAKKYPDVTIIGMASSERPGKDPKVDTRLEGVEKFVKEQGDKMDYTVAYDADRKMTAAWMQPAGQGGIPCAFIVNGEGKIAWIGNPHDDKFESEIGKLAKAVEPKKDAKDAKKPAKAKPADEHKEKTKK